MNSFISLLSNGLYFLIGILVLIIPQLGLNTTSILSQCDLAYCYLTDYTRNFKMLVIFHAWYKNTFVLYIPHAWRGIFQRDYFL